MEEFVKHKSIRFNEADKCRTFLVVEDGKILTETGKLRILGYFSILTKSLTLPDGMSRSKRKRYDGMDKNADCIDCYLIGQLAKNEQYNTLQGSFLLDLAIENIREAQKIIGRRVVLIECIDNAKVKGFYEDYGFEYIGPNIDNNLEQMVYEL